MATAVATVIIYTIVAGSSPESFGSGAFDGEFVVRVTGGDTTFLRDQKGGVRYFTSRSGARKAITREKTGDYHR
jgi:hypothetical protein